MSPRERWARLRPVMVFAATLIVLLTVGRGWSGRRSHDNHFVHMAAGWLEGRVALNGDPPGWKKGRADDWARVWTVELRSGESFRGHRCQTHACRDESERDDVSVWRTTQGELVRTHRRDIVKRRATWYVSFPPGPAFIMLPGVAIWGLRFSDVVFTAFVGALVPAILLWFLDRARGMRREHLWCVAAWALGSPALFVAAHGRVWFTAQIVAALFLSSYVAAVWQLRRPGWAGLCLGLAVACRPHLVLAAVLFGAIWWNSQRSSRAALRFLVPLLVVVIALGWYNAIRFDDVFEFGHRYLVVRWQARMQDVGMFALAYVPRNITCLTVLWPQWHGGWPPLRVSIHGLGLLWTTPWLLWTARTRAPVDHRWALWLTAALVSLPSLLYQNSGQLQFTYRFALDWLPLVVVVVGLGDLRPPRAFAATIVVAIVVQFYGAWMFARHPRQLFAFDPVGWPFADEFEP